MKVCVVGIDAVSLTLAAHYTLRGLPAVVTDRDATVVGAAVGGALPEPADDDLVWGLKHAREAGLSFDPSIVSAVQQAEVVVFTTPLGYARGAVDDGPVRDAAAQVGAGIRANTLLLVETMLGVGDTESLVGAAVADRSGLSIGDGFSLTYCPPQCGPGTVLQDLSRAPRVFGSFDARSRELAAAFFAHVSQTILAPVRNCATAELAPLYQLCSRGVGGAFAAQLASMGAARDVDPLELTANAAAQTLFPVLAPRLVPSPGDVMLALALLGRGESQTFARQALRQHLGVLKGTCARLADLLGDLRGKQVVVVRASRGPDFGVDDVVLELEERGAVARVVTQLGGELPVDVDAAVDAIVGLDPLPCMRDLAGFPGRVFVDGTGRASRNQVEQLGLRYLGVGSGG